MNSITAELTEEEYKVLQDYKNKKAKESMLKNLEQHNEFGKKPWIKMSADYFSSHYNNKYAFEKEKEKVHGNDCYYLYQIRINNTEILNTLKRNMNRCNMTVPEVVYTIEVDSNKNIKAVNSSTELMSFCFWKYYNPFIDKEWLKKMIPYDEKIADGTSDTRTIKILNKNFYDELHPLLDKILPLQDSEKEIKKTLVEKMDNLNLIDED